MTPPKPRMEVRIMQVIDYVEMLSRGVSESEIHFRDSVEKTFVRTGCFPRDGSDNFVQYSSIKGADHGEISASHKRPTNIDLTAEADLVENVGELLIEEDNDSDYD